MQIFTNRALSTPENDAAYQTIYKCPTSTTSTIHNLLITNNSTSEDVTINLKLKKSGKEFSYIPSDFILDHKNTLEMKPINLVADDELIVSSTNTVDVIASILEERLPY